MYTFCLPVPGSQIVGKTRKRLSRSLEQANFLSASFSGKITLFFFILAKEICIMR